MGHSEGRVAEAWSALRGHQIKMPKRTRGVQVLPLFAKALSLSDKKIDDSKFLLSVWLTAKLRLWCLIDTDLWEKTV